MNSAPTWITNRGIERLLSRENNITDLLQYLTDLDPKPWNTLVGFVPVSTSREFRLRRSKSSNNKKAGDSDLYLVNSDGKDLILEVKLGHVFSDDQQERYENWNPENANLALAALQMDEDRVLNDDRWSFLSLARIFGQWQGSESADASVLAQTIFQVIKDWDRKLNSVFLPNDDPDSLALSNIDRKFLARVVSRRICNELSHRGYDFRATTTSGSGGLAVSEAYRWVGEEKGRYFIAEVRWWGKHPGGELRFGVDFWLEESISARKAASDLAHNMSNSIDVQALKHFLSRERSQLADLLTRTDSGRPGAKSKVIDGEEHTWEDVVKRGYRSSSSDGVAATRRNVSPAFYGDGTQRFEALSPIDFSQATAQDVIEIMDQTLIFLDRRHQHLMNP